MEDWLLHCPFSQENDEDRPHQYFNVEPYRPIIDVFQVQFHPLVEVNLVPSAHLPETRNSGFHAQAPPLPPFIFLNLFRYWGPGAHKAHIPPQNVEELGEFVQTGFAEEPAHPSYPGVVLHLEYRPGH